MSVQTFHRWLSRPQTLHATPLRAHWPHLLAVFVILVAVYAMTAPRSVALEDDGEFILCASVPGVAHPPGYPLYTILAYPFSWLPIGSLAYRIHLASGVFGALACTVLWWIAHTLTGQRIASHAAALGFGVSAVFWSQSIIAEVYTLNTLLFLVLLAVVIGYVQEPRRLCLRVFAVVLGLGLSNHWPLIVLATPGVLLVAYPAGRALLRDLPREALMMGLLFCAGLLPYAWIVVVSNMQPDHAFYGAVDSFSSFFFYVNRSGYSALEDSPSAGLADKLGFAGFLMREALVQFTYFGAAVAVLGLAVTWRARGALNCGLGLVFLTGTLLLAALVGLDYQYVSRAVFRVYPLLPYAVAAIWIAFGTSAVVGWLGRLSPVAAGPAGIGLAAVLVGATFFTHLEVNNRRDYSYARDYGTTLLEAVDENATIFTTGDVDSIVLGYLHLAEGIRPDVKIINNECVGMHRGGRLFNPTTTPNDQRQAIIREYIRSHDGSIYFVGGAPSDWGHVDFGFFQKINKEIEGKRGGLNDSLRDLFHRIEAMPEPTDPWTYQSRQVSISRYAAILAIIVYGHPDREYAETFRADLDLASGHFLGLLNRVIMLDTIKYLNVPELLQWTEEAEAMMTESVSKRDRSILYYMKSRCLSRLKRPDEALEAMQTAWETYPHPENENARRAVEQMEQRRSSR